MTKRIYEVLDKKTLGEIVEDTENAISDACYTFLFVLHGANSQAIRQISSRMLESLTPLLAEIYLVKAACIYSVYHNYRVGKYSKKIRKEYTNNLIFSAFKLNNDIKLKPSYTIRYSTNQAAVNHKLLAVHNYKTVFRPQPEVMQKINEILDLKMAFKLRHEKLLTELAKDNS